MADVADLAIRARTQGVKKADRELDGLGRAASGARKTVTALGAAFAALAGTGGAVVAASNRISKAARETQNMADIANVSVEQLQRMSLASREVGVSQGQLSQILLDTQDRIGDFLATGGGEFQEFFERIAPQVGLTAEKLAQMSGPDALMAMYDALEQANLSASETRFYMEALASDSSRLIPLLKNNAEGFRESAERADEMNAVLSETEVRNLSDLSDTLGEMRTRLDARMAKAVADNADAVERLAERLTDVAEAGLYAADGISTFASAIADSGLGREIDRVSDALPDMVSAIFEVSGQAQAVKELFSIFDDDEGDFGRIDPLVIRDFGGAVQDSIGPVRTLSQEMDVLGESIPDQNIVTLSREFENLQSVLGENLFRIASEGVEDIRDQVSPGRAELREYREQLELLDLAVEQNIISSEQASGLQRQLNDQLSDQATGVRTLTGEYNALQDAVDRARDKQEEFSENSSQRVSSAVQTMSMGFAELGVEIGKSFDGIGESSQAAIAAVGAAMGNVQKIMKEGGEESFQTYKRLAQAEAAIAGALAVQKALASAPPPANIALAGTIGALTAVQVAAIEEQEYSGRKTGGQVRAGESYMVGENGPEIVTMNGGGHVTPNHQINSGNSNNVTQVFQLSDNARRETRQQIMESAPMIRNMAKKAVIEAAQQGGSMSRAVGSRN